MLPLRLRRVAGHEGRLNDALFQPAARPSATSQDHHTLVYFPGDVQDYPELMAAHRDNRNYQNWNLERTARLLGQSFPHQHILVVRPSRIEFKSFSCYDNFVPSNNAGVPDHTPTHQALRHLERLLQSVSARLKQMPASELLEAVSSASQREEIDIEELHVMTADDSDGILIPSVFVTNTTGLALAQKYLYDQEYYIMVNSELPFNINTHLLLPFAIVVVLCLLVILIFMIVKCINDRRRARRHRLPDRALSKIPTCKFSKGDPYETCAICLDDYQEGEVLRVLPCAHAYHSACIDPWLTQNKRVCPVCKRRVFTAGERRRRNSSSSSDDTEPLLPERPITHGGTFDEQRENPFARATRFMARLRARHERGDNTESGRTPPNDNDHMNGNNDENGNMSETAPLVPEVSAVSERRMRGRSTRRPRGSRAQHLSINTTGRGEIGVAAIPALHSTPRNVSL